MNTNETKNSQAFPGAVLDKNDDIVRCEPGFTKQELAAMTLRVPNSGLPWLDEMIEQSLWDEFAKAALQGLLSRNGCVQSSDVYEVVDAMLAARKGESS